MSLLDYEPGLGKNPDLIPISNSEIGTFKECKRKWYLSYYIGLGERDRKATGALAFGTRIHKCLEEMYKNGRDPVEVHKELIELDQQELTENGVNTEDLMKDADLGRIMLEGYLEWIEETGADFDIEITDSEKKLTTSLFDGKVELRGKIDLRILRRTDNARMFLDFKALSVNQQILTPAGFKRFGDVKVGDVVTGPDGKDTNVLGVFPQGRVPLFRVKFNNGTSVLACDDHLWSVYENGSSIEKVKTTRELRENLYRGSQKHQYRYSIPRVGVDSINIESNGEDLPLDPYWLGVWLGDGCRGTSTTLSCHEPDIVSRVNQRLPDGWALEPNNTGVLYTMRSPRHLKPNGKSTSRVVLESLELYGLYSYQKFVPDMFKNTSSENRLELLRGLMDTDGTVAKHNNSTVFCTTSRLLAEDVAWLARSLGGDATVNKVSTNSFQNSKPRDVFNTNISMPRDLPPFGLERKRNKWLEHSRNMRAKTIISIEFEDVGEAQCIVVDHPSHLFVVDDFTVTHNTLAQYDTYLKTAHMAEQLKLYLLLENMNNDEEQRVDGAKYRLLKKVKRTERAKPPFYMDVDIRHNKKTLESFWYALHGVVKNMLDLRQQLDEGADPNHVAYPTPSNDCTWKCPFYTACPMFDDGSAVSEFVDRHFVQYDPYARYEEEEK